MRTAVGNIVLMFTLAEVGVTEGTFEDVPPKLALGNKFPSLLTSDQPSENVVEDSTNEG